MKSRNLAVRLAVVVSSAFALAAVGPALGTAPAAADMNVEGLKPPAIPEIPEPPEVTPPEPFEFTIEKLQEIAGSGRGFTKSPLIGAIGETVDYEIIVTNRGILSETLKFTDPQCDAGTIAPDPGEGQLTQKGSVRYTCSHVLDAPGAYTNEATVTATREHTIGCGCEPLTHTSNQVVVEVPAPPPPKPEFTIEKLQEIADSGRGFTTSPLTGATGQTVDYEMIVTNTGNEPLALSEFSDEHCDSGTLAGGPGQALLAVGASTTYTCTRVLSSEGRFTNEATVMGTPPNGLPMTHTSNQVEVVVPPHAGSPASPSALPAPAAAVGPAQAAQGVEPCKASAPAVRLPSGPKRGPFTVRVSSAGVSQITFYLDGRKLRAMKQSQAKGGHFTIKIDPRRLKLGPHKLSVKGTSTDPSCGTIARASTFVRPSRAVRPVKFAG